MNPVSVQTVYERAVSMPSDTKLKNLRPAEKVYKVPDRDGCEVARGYSD
jgi:hypothetical protein